MSKILLSLEYPAFERVVRTRPDLSERKQAEKILGILEEKGYRSLSYWKVYHTLRRNRSRIQNKYRNSFRVGDPVRVVNRIEEVPGWHEVWVPQMNKCVGRVGRINHVHHKQGIFVKFEDTGRGWWFPAAALELHRLPLAEGTSSDD